MTGAPVAGFAALLSGSRLTVSAPGYVARETAAGAARVDLFPEQGFDLPFYRQLVRDDLDKSEGTPHPLWVLPAAPAFYMEVEGAKGLPQQAAARLEQVARRIVPLLTGGRFQVTRWETGPTPRPRQQGWITIERHDETAVCGRGWVGALDGRIELGLDGSCLPYIESAFAHELGHAFGFFHVDRVGSMMYRWSHSGGSSTEAPTDLERHHMALAYARPRGNRDIDVDPESASSALRGARMIVD